MGRQSTSNRHTKGGCSRKGVLICVVIGASMALMIFVIIAQALAVEEFLIMPTFREGEVDFIPAEHFGGKLALAERLAKALRIQTVSQDKGKYNTEALLQMHRLLESLFPTVYKSPYVEREVVNSYSLLYSIKGTDPMLRPYLLMAHLDVVPAPNPEKWESPPFAGAIVNETYLYGRGAMDDKEAVMGILEGLEYYLKSGRRPVRSFYIAFGHDEEVSGFDGAQHLSKRLAEKGIDKLDFILDEGAGISTGEIKQIPGRVIMIALAEKGMLDVELTVKWTPGHASTPPKQTCISILSRAVDRISVNEQPSLFGKGLEVVTFQYIAPYVSFLYKIVFANLWMFGGVVSRVMSHTTVGSAVLRTTTAVTKFEAGFQSNIVPGTARAVLHHRIHPSQTLEDVLAEDARIMDDSRIQMQVRYYRPPSAVADHGSSATGFMVTAASAKQIYPEAVVAPVMMFANTDTSWYRNFTHNMYRFSLLDTVPSDYPRIHGFNERIAVENYYWLVNFYYRFIRNAELLADGSNRTPQRNVEL